jgi:1-acyl-sn-glycerol-3-phosphate acyltransferase
VAILRALIRLFLLVILLFLGLVIELAAFPFLSSTGREFCIKHWCKSILWVVGARLKVSGIAPSGPCQIAANHSSWLDILTINSQRASQFVAKSEIRSWPVVGLLVARAGTHFIERAKRRAVHTVLQSTVKALQAGRTIAVFPEGATNDGRSLRPFHANLIQAGLDARVPLKPLAIRYTNREGDLSEAIVYVGETTFLVSMWRVLQLPVIHADLAWGDEFAPEGTRHELCHQLEEQISKLTGLAISTNRKAPVFTAAIGES